MTNIINELGLAQIGEYELEAFTQLYSFHKEYDLKVEQEDITQFFIFAKDGLFTQVKLENLLDLISSGQLNSNNLSPAIKYMLLRSVNRYMLLIKRDTDDLSALEELLSRSSKWSDATGPIINYEIGLFLLGYLLSVQVALADEDQHFIMSLVSYLEAYIRKNCSITLRSLEVIELFRSYSDSLGSLWSQQLFLHIDNLNREKALISDELSNWQDILGGIKRLPLPDNLDALMVIIRFSNLIDSDTITLESVQKSLGYDSDYLLAASTAIADKINLLEQRIRNIESVIKTNRDQAIIIRTLDSANED